MEAILEEQVEEYLHPKPGLLGRLHFPAALEAMYESKRLESRRRQLTYTGLLALVCYDLFLFADYARCPSVFWRCFLLRIVVFTPSVLVTAWFVHDRARAAIRELLVLLNVTTAGAIVLGVSYNLSRVDSVFSQAGFILVIFFGSLILRQQFAYAIATSLLLFFADGVFLATDRWMTVNDKVNTLFIVSTCAVLTVMANYMMERQERLSFAHLLKQDINGKDLLRLNLKLTALSQVDGLTGLSNRRHFDERFETVWNEAMKSGGRLSLLMIDIDHFKRLNDTFGHIAGDQVLVKMGKVLAASVRSDEDVVARFGGEEFILLLPGATHEDSHTIADDLQRMISTATFSPTDGEGALSVTVSCGLATIAPLASDDRLTLVGEADLALYAAKRGGRNQVACRMCERMLPERRWQRSGISIETTTEGQPSAACLNFVQG